MSDVEALNRLFNQSMYGQDFPPAKLNEASFQKQVEDLCGKHDVLYHHCGTARTCHGKGLPDLLLAGKYHLGFRELKMSGNDPRHEQVTWKYRLLASGQDYKVWYPKDLYSGLIEQELAALNKP